MTSIKKIPFPFSAHFNYENLNIPEYNWHFKDGIAKNLLKEHSAIECDFLLCAKMKTFKTHIE